MAKTTLVVVGGSGNHGAAVSIDGTNWFQATLFFGITDGPSFVEWANRYFITGGTRATLNKSTADAHSWQGAISTHADITVAVTGAAWDGHQWVMTSASGDVVTSPDAITWTNRGNPTGFALWGVAWSESLGLFVAVGDAVRPIRSTDGISWVSSAVIPGTGISQVFDIVWAPSLGVFAAACSYSGAVRNQVLTSSDGVNWTPHDSQFGTFASSGGNQTAWAIAWSESLGLFVIGGDAGRITTSSDGLFWHEEVSAVTTKIQHVRWIESYGMFAAVTSGGEYMTSPDGRSWTKQPNPLGGTTALSDVAAGEETARHAWGPRDVGW